MATDYSFKGGLSPDAILAAFQKKAQLEQQQQELALKQDAQNQSQWLQTAELASQAVSGTIESVKQKQKKDFINTLADSLANQAFANPTPAIVSMGTGEQQTANTAAFDPLASDAMRASVNLAPEKAADAVISSQFKDPLEQQKLALAKEKLDILRAKIAADKDNKNKEKNNYVRQLFDVAGQPYAVLSKVDDKGQPIVVPVSGASGERGAFVKPPLSGELTQQLADFETLEALSKKLTSLTDDQLKAYVGPANARVEKVKLYTPKGDKDAGKFFQNIQDIKNQIIYLRSGKQINESEYKRLIDAMPDENKNAAVFKVQAQQFVKTFQLIMKNRREALSKSYRNVSMSTPQDNPNIQDGNFSNMSTDDLINLLSEE